MKDSRLFDMRTSGHSHGLFTWNSLKRDITSDPTKVRELPEILG